jgi:hypothetical protein
MRESYKEYIQNLSLSNLFKNQIIDENFAQNNPVYYQNYPSLFSKAFLVPEKELELLNTAGYLYYQATIFADSLLDEQDASKFPLILICQEESIKILTHIFGLNHNFWQVWNTRKQEYLEAIYLEKSFSKKESVTIGEYELLADKKSAFGKVAIDCLYCFDNINIDSYNQLLLSHKYFSVAFQLNDDIQDLKSDIEKGQFNWAKYLLQQEKIDNKDPKTLEKFLYIRGIATQMYKLGINYCDKAYSAIENVNVADWKNVLMETKKSFLVSIKEIENYLEILSSGISLSKKKKSCVTIENSIKYAIEFIKSKQIADGSWREYVNQGGISNVWATAFIITKISEVEILKSNLNNEITNALSFIVNNRTENLWSYNTTWIADADSTNFVLLSLLYNEKKIDDLVFKNWLSFQNSNGGFSTYNDKEKLLLALDDELIKNVDGWTSTHNCVSAVSFYFLAKYNQNNENLTRIKTYFDLNFDKKEEAYWWTNKIYTLYYLSKTYVILSQKEKIISIVDKVKKLQNINGSFSDKYGENLFYTGLALEILALDAENTVLESKKALQYLLENQYEDGSWDNSFALQVPLASDCIPEEIEYPISSFGMNVRAKEFNRLFTTTTVLQAISYYEQKYNS